MKDRTFTIVVHVFADDMSEPTAIREAIQAALRKRPVALGELFHVGSVMELPLPAHSDASASTVPLGALEDSNDF